MNPSFFLIRTKQNRILGPVVKEDLVKRVLHGELDTLDEICPASGYWVYLHEREEVLRVLGVEPPIKKKPKDDDDTETETETATATSTATATATDKVLQPVPLGTAESGRNMKPVPDYNVERPSLVKLTLYIFLGVLVFILLKIYDLTQS